MAGENSSELRQSAVSFLERLRENRISYNNTLSEASSLLKILGITSKCLLEEIIGEEGETKMKHMEPDFLSRAIAAAIKETIDEIDRGRRLTETAILKKMSSDKIKSVLEERIRHYFYLSLRAIEEVRGRKFPFRKHHRPH